MDIARINKRDFIDISMTMYDGIKDSVLSINIFTIVRIGFLTARSYSDSISFLHNGGVAELVTASVKDIIVRLYNTKRISDEVYSTLISNYNTIKNDMLKDAVNEMLIVSNLHNLFPPDDVANDPGCVIS